MKTALIIRQKWMIILFAILASFFFSACQDEVFEPDIPETQTMKNGPMSTPAEGTLPSGALYEIKLPSSWQHPLSPRVLLVYAHGYVDFDHPIELPSDAIPYDLGGEIPISTFITDTLNMGYATTSYRDNGLVVVEAIDDIIQLRTKIGEYFLTHPGIAPPNAILLVGPSEGGLITVLTIEQNPGLFTAAIATCCPIGNFYEQLQYYGDAHVLFKYFFGNNLKGIPLGSPRHIPQRTIQAWNDHTLQDAIIDVLTKDYIHNDGETIQQYLNCAKIPSAPGNPEMAVKNILEVLRFSFKATNDAICRLNGNPYNNKFPKRIYSGSANDLKLNQHVERIRLGTWKFAHKTVNEKFETSGAPLSTLVIIHGEYDHVALGWHHELYLNKYASIPPMQKAPLIPDYITNLYGHCNFTTSDIRGILEELIDLLQNP